MTFRQDSTRSRDKKQFPTSVVYFIRERERARDGGVSEERRSRSAQAAVISGCVVTETSQPISNHHVCAVSIFPFSPHLKPPPLHPPLRSRISLTSKRFWHRQPEASDAATCGEGHGHWAVPAWKVGHRRLLSKQPNNGGLFSKKPGFAPPPRPAGSPGHGGPN